MDITKSFISLPFSYFVSAYCRTVVLSSARFLVCTHFCSSCSLRWVPHRNEHIPLILRLQKWPHRKRYKFYIRPLSVLLILTAGVLFLYKILLDISKSFISLPFSYFVSAFYNPSDSSSHLPLHKGGFLAKFRHSLYKDCII